MFHGQFLEFDPIWSWPKPVQVPHPPVLIGGDGPRSLRVAGECGNGWMPVVAEAAGFEAKLTQLHRLCEEAGRPDLQVTAAVWGLGERLLARCAELGIYRCAVVAPTRDMAALQSFLDRYRHVADRVCR